MSSLQDAAVLAESIHRHFSPKDWTDLPGLQVKRQDPEDLPRAHERLARAFRAYEQEAVARTTPKVLESNQPSHSLSVCASSLTASWGLNLIAGVDILLRVSQLVSIGWFQVLGSYKAVETLHNRVFLEPSFHTARKGQGAHMLQSVQELRRLGVGTKDAESGRLDRIALEVVTNKVRQGRLVKEEEE